MKLHPEYPATKAGGITRIRSYVPLFALLGVFFAAIAYGSTGGKEILSADERAWLTQNQQRLVLAVETGYAPFVFIDSKDQPTGFAHDYLRLIESRLDVHFKQRRFSSLNDIFEKVHSGEVHIVNAVTNTPERARFLAMTDSFVSVPNVIIVTKNRSGQMREKDLSGLKVSLVKSYAVTEHLANNNPGFLPNLVPDDLTALLNVSFGQSDAAVIDLATASYLISKKGIANLRVAGEVAYDIRLSLAAPLDEPVLYGILQKGLNAITDAERQEIKNRWISSSNPQSIFKERQFWIILGSVIAVAFAILFIILVWNRTLRRQIVLRKKAEEAINAAAQYSRSLIEASLDPLVTISAEGKITDANAATERVTGVDRANLLGSDFANYFTDSEKAREGYRQAFSQGFVTDYPLAIRHVSGKITDVLYNASVYRDTGGNVLGVFAAARDITERKLVENELREKEERLALATLHNGVGVWDWNLITQEMVWDDSMFSLYRIRREDFIGTEEAWRAALHPDDLGRGDQEVNDAIAGIKPFNTEFRVVWPNGEIHYIKAVAKVFRDEQGTPFRMLGINMDITERKEFEEELQRSNVDLEQFAYAVSHDMRQPLRMVASYLQLLEIGLAGQLDGEKRSYFDIAIEGAKRIDQMLMELLEYSRVGRMGEQLTWIDSRATLDEALQFLQPALNESQARLNIGREWPHIMASHDEILRLLQNLIGNAVKFRVAGRIPEITITSQTVKNEWYLCVADNGVGIIPEQSKRLFQVFQRLHSREAYEGTGIGLALCRKIAEHHKGRIWAESAGEGRGSKFCVALPMQQQEKK